MAKIIRNHYVLAVHDLDRTRDWFERVLGCTVEMTVENDWCFLRRDDVTIMCGRCPNDLPASRLGCHSLFAYLKVDDADSFYKRAKEQNSDFTKELRDEPWGMREFGLRTCDGHRIMIGQEIVQDS